MANDATNVPVMTNSSKLSKAKPPSLNSFAKKDRTGGGKLGKASTLSETLSRLRQKGALK